MPRPVDLTLTSAVQANRDEVWRSVATMPGVNYELWPFVRMTSPSEHQRLRAPTVPGQILFKSWLLVFGVVPFDRHCLGLEHVEEGHGFVEVSSSWLQRRWRHERTLVDEPGTGCTVTDHLVIEPRLRLARPLVAALVPRLFGHRHRRLGKRFGPSQPARPGS